VAKLQQQLKDSFKESAKGSLRLIGYLDELDGMKHSVYGDLIYANKFDFESQDDVSKLVSEKKELVAKNGLEKKEREDLKAAEIENSNLNTERVERVKALGLEDSFTVDEMYELFNYSDGDFDQVLEARILLKDEERKKDEERNERLAGDKKVLMEYVAELRAVVLKSDQLVNPEALAFSEELKFHIGKVLELSELKIGDI